MWPVSRTSPRKMLSDKGIVVSATVDLHGDGSRVIRDRRGEHQVRIVVWPEYRYHPSGNVAQITFNFRVLDDQTGLDDDDRRDRDPASVIAGQVLRGLQ